MGVNPMMANMAMAYGSDFAAKGQEEIRRNLDKYVSIGQLKYYFAVDTSYVTRKLGEFSIKHLFLVWYGFRLPGILCIGPSTTIITVTNFVGFVCELASLILG